MAKFINPPAGSPIAIPAFRLPSGSRRQLVTLDGLELVKDFEGCALEAYLDSVGVPTLAFGRIRYPNGASVRLGDRCTLAQAFEWLFLDLAEEGAKYVAAFTKHPELLSDCQWSALVSFTYNRGSGRFDEKLDDFVDEATDDGNVDWAEVQKISNALLEYDYAGKGANRKKLLGLTRRRWAEREMFRGGDWRRFSGPLWMKNMVLDGVKGMLVA